MRNRDAGHPRWQYLLWNFSKCLYDIWQSASHGFVMWRSMSHAQNAVEERVHSNILYAWKRKVKVRLNYETQKLHNFFLQAYSLFLSLSLSLSLSFLIDFSASVIITFFWLHYRIFLLHFIYISGGPLSALTCCVNVRLLSAIKKISPLIYSQSWVGSWVYTTQAMMTFTLIF